MSRIKSFGDFHSLNEGKIPMYLPGDNLKASKSMRVVDVIRDFKKLLDKEQPFTVVVNTEGMKTANPTKPEMDVVGLEGEGDGGLIVLRDYKGREFKIKAGKILEILVGDSIKDNVILNTAYFVEGKDRMKIKNFDGKELTVYVHGEGERKIPLAEWKGYRKDFVD
jgi:uncharacterized protein YhfF